jgi:D-2-hydroxyglutarate dehydrogenase
VFKYDVSLPLERMYEMVEAVRARLGCEEGGDVRAVGGAGADDAGGASSSSSSSRQQGVRVVGYGHVGDGNLHLNVSAPQGYDPDLLRRLEPFVFEWVRAAGGSVSAGLGQQKARAIGYSKTLAAVSVMRRLKRELDPNGILNPYKVLPEEGRETMEAEEEAEVGGSRTEVAAGGGGGRAAAE